MDMGIIAALKKRYKYHLIREILTYHDSPENVKIRLEDVAKRMRRGSVGLTFGKSAHLLDAANLIVIAWNEITQETLFNCYEVIKPCVANMKTDFETKDDRHIESSFVVKPFLGEKKERTMEAIYIWLGESFILSFTLRLIVRKITYVTHELSGNFATSWCGLHTAKKPLNTWYNFIDIFK